METEFGVDVSRWQNEPIKDKKGVIVGYKPLNYQKAKDNGVEFAIVRATVGDYYIDPTFKMNFEGFRDVGVDTSAFMVTTPMDSSKSRLVSAEAHILKLQEAFSLIGSWPKIRVTVDNELDRGATPRQITALIQKIFSLLLEPVNYTRANWWNQYVLRSNSWKDVDLHVAHYTKGEPILPLDYKDYYIHQFSADENTLGRHYGAFSEAIDLNRRKPKKASPVPPIAEPEPLVSFEDNVKVIIGGVPYRLVKE